MRRQSAPHKGRPVAGVQESKARVAGRRFKSSALSCIATKRIEALVGLRHGEFAKKRQAQTKKDPCPL